VGYLLQSVFSASPGEALINKAIMVVITGYPVVRVVVTMQAVARNLADAGWNCVACCSMVEN
jgi:hypothetical protein